MNKYSKGWKELNQPKKNDSYILGFLTLLAGFSLIIGFAIIF